MRAINVPNLNTLFYFVVNYPKEVADIRHILQRGTTEVCVAARDMENDSNLDSV